MSQAKKNQSYYIIAQLFQQKGQVSTLEIQQKLEAAELPSSESTTQRLIKDLKNIGLTLEYDNQKRKYIFNEEGSSMQIKILNLMVASDFLHEVATSPADKLKYIEFDARMVAKGANFLPDIFNAITKRKWLEVEYKRYENEVSKIHILAPLFLKEFNNRWYLLAVYKGELKGKNNIPLIFGIDRILNIEVTIDSFEKNLFKKLHDYPKWQKENKESPMDLFNDMIGVRLTEQPVQEVILKFSPEQAPFIKSQPWHSTQEILAENENEFKISICVRPNDDLLTMILAQHGNVEVLEPESLRSQTIGILKKSLALYSTKS